MSILTTGNTYVVNDQVTATNLNAAVNGAAFASGAVDGATTQLSGGSIIVRDGGITPAKLSTGGPNWTAGGALSATSIQNTPVGNTTRSSGAFTTLTANGAFSLTGDTVQVTEGGTGAATAGDARTNLGATTVGSNLFTLPNPSAIRFVRLNADNTVSALTDSDFRTAIGAGGGGGTIIGSTGSTDNRILRADGTGGSTLQSSAVSIDDSGNVDGVGNLTASGVFNTTSEYRVSGTKVLGAQQAAEGNLSVTGSLIGSDTIDVNAVLTAVTNLENKVNSLLGKLRTHGIIAT